MILRRRAARSASAHPPRQIRALLAHATTSRFAGPAPLELTILEKRTRCKQPRSADQGRDYGSIKSLDRFDWMRQRAIERELFEELHETLGFRERGANALFRGEARRTRQWSYRPPHDARLRTRGCVLAVAGNR
jgi:hypothetical protein